MHLKHLDVQGFKTFANRTNFIFDLGVTAIVGPNGSGKCITGETRVTLADGREVPIQQIVDAALRDARTIESDNDGEITRENPHAIDVLSINPIFLRLEAQPVAAFVKRRAPEYLLQIQTRSGRQVTATPYHPLFTFENGMLRALRADELQTGVRIAVPRTLPMAHDPNLDLIPGITPIIKDAARAANVKIKPNRCDHPKLAAYTANQCLPSRGGLLETVAAIEQLGTTPHHARAHLEKIATVARSDIYWDEIVSLERVAPREEWVYDLCVAGTHNFVAGNIIVHNSNVADAVRWVMGEQSFSELRVKKTEDLIFTGSATRPRLGMAEVSLTFENPNPWTEESPAPTGEKISRADPVGELMRSNPSEVTIGRRAFRDGQNEYFLNGTRVRLRDILELLARWGLARNTYAVIGQGLVDQALSLRPEERRALFEEAAGIGLYQSKRQNALDKLAETQQNLLRVNDIINELAPRLPSLARQAERARNYDGVVASLDDRLRTWYAYQWHRAQGVAQEMAVREKNSREILNTRRGEVQATATRLAQLRRQGQELRAQLAESRRARAALESEHANRTRELAVIEERLRFTTQQRDEAATELIPFDEAKRAQAHKIERAAQTRQSKEQERNALAERLTVSEKELRDLEHRAAHAETLLEESEPQIRQLAQKLAQLKAELGVYEQGLREASALSAQADALTSIEFKRAQAANAVEVSRANIAELRAGLTIAERDVAGARSAEESARRDLAQIESQLTAKQRRVETSNRQVAELTAERDQLQTRADESSRALAEIDARVAPVDAGLADAEKAQQELEEHESILRARLAEFEDAHNGAVLDVERARAEIARLETEIEDDLASGRIVSEIKTVDEIEGATRETFISINADLPQQLRLQLGDEMIALPVITAAPEGLEKEIRKLRNQLKYMGTVNPNAPQEYDELKARHTFLTEQAADATHAIESLNKAIAELDEIMRQRFTETFKAIGIEFTKFFALLFNGGTARLELTDPENITQSGIDITARPPGKRAAHLAMLSGGERALTAAALLFAILKVSPTPFCVLDEVDAALDEANVGRFRDALRTLAAETQFIVITHNRTTIESANAVYGITMSDDGVSQAISLRLDVNGNGKNGTQASVDERG